MRNQEIIGLVEAYSSIYANLSESHFKVGDEVVCKKSGMEGEVVKVDPEEKGKYYTVKREDGKMVKYAPDELKLDKEEDEEEGADKEEETKFHSELDKMVHKTFGKRKEEKGMKEEVSEDLQQKVGKALDAAAKNPVVKAIGKVIAPVGKGRKTPTATSGGYRKEEVEVDIFDVILEHLVAEGYADTNQAALAIMANMSEEWKQSIVEMSLSSPLFNRPSNRIDRKPSASKPSSDTRPVAKPGMTPMQRLQSRPDTTIR